MGLLLDEAIRYATEKHKGQRRKIANTPYIFHPMEVATIIATASDSEETMAAGLLHDTIEDSHVDPSEILEKFGPRVASLVASETEDKMYELPRQSTWHQRKERSLRDLEKTQDREVKILWLADKLSNLRSFLREYHKFGNRIWESTNQKDPAAQCWYYTSIAKYTEELKDTEMYREYLRILNELFEEQRTYGNDPGNL